MQVLLLSQNESYGKYLIRIKKIVKTYSLIFKSGLSTPRGNKQVLIPTPLLSTSQWPWDASAHPRPSPFPFLSRRRVSRTTAGRRRYCCILVAVCPVCVTCVCLFAALNSGFCVRLLRAASTRLLRVVSTLRQVSSRSCSTVAMHGQPRARVLCVYIST